MTKKKAARRSTKKITLNEFRAWLEGVEELQADDWSPTYDQWQLIRNKINNIVEEVKEVQVPANVPDVPPPAGPLPTYGGRTVSGDTFGSPGTNPAFVPPAPPMPPPPMGGALDDMEMTPAAQAALNGKLPSTMVPSPDGKIKTPNLDTSDGNFTSGFE